MHVRNVTESKCCERNPELRKVEVLVSELDDRRVVGLRVTCPYCGQVHQWMADARPSLSGPTMEPV